MDSDQTTNQPKDSHNQFIDEHEVFNNQEINNTTLFYNVINEVLNLFSLPTILINNHLVIKSCNQLAAQWVSLDEKQIIGKSISSFFPFETEEIESRITQLSNNLEKEEFICNVNIVDKPHTFRFNILPFKYIAGNTNIFLSFNNEYKHKHQEQEKEEQIFWLTSILNSTSEIYILCSTSGEILFANRSAIKMLTKHSVIHEKTNFFSLLPKNKIALHEKYFFRAVEANEITSFSEKRNKLYYEYTIIPLSISGFNSKNVLIHCRNVTTERESLLKNSKTIEAYTSLLDRISEITLIITAEGEIEYINKSGIDFFSLPDDKRVKKNFFSGLSQKSKNQLKDAIRELNNTQKETQIELKYRNNMNYPRMKQKLNISAISSSDQQFSRFMLILS